MTLEHWYALSVVAGREKSIRKRILERLDKANLTSPDLILICPDEEVILARGTSEQQRTRRLTLPGYILMSCRHLTTSRIVSIKGTAGVLGFLGGNEKPKPLPETEVDHILGHAHYTAAGRRAENAWQKGQEVTIIEGPMSDFSGTIEKIDQRHNVATVLIEIFGRQTSVQVPGHQLRAT